MRTVSLLFLMVVSSLVSAQEENGEDIDARVHYRFMMRTNENREIPFNALMNAKHDLDAKRSLRKGPAAQPDNAGLTGWESLGPGNIGGRIRSIVINPNVPNVMYVGAVSGGIWRTDNAGDSWYPLDDFMASLNVTSIVMDPNNPVVMYAATGEGFSGSSGPGPNPAAPGGAGVFKSTDAGLTWNQLQSTANAQWSFVNRLSHHPTLSNILLAATASGVYRTVDGGTSWIRVLPFVNAYQVKYHPTDPSRALCGTSSGFYLSTDGGLNFTGQNGNPPKLPVASNRCEGDFARTDNTVYVNMNRNDGEVWRSIDGGTTWTLQSDSVKYFGGSGQYDNAIWVDPTNSNFILVSGRNLQRSIDGGVTLAKIGGDTSGAMIFSVHPDIHAIVSHPQYNGTTNKTVFIGCDGGIYGTQDISTASLTSGWLYLNHSLGITQFYSGAVAVDGSLIVGGAQDNDRLHYTPSRGSEGWFAAGGSAAGGDGTTTAVDFTNSNRVYAAATKLSIARSDDGGRTYNPKVNGIADVGLWLSPFLIDPNNANVLLAGGTKLWKTTNYADSWTQFRDVIATTPTCSVIDIAKGNSSIIWVGYDNGQISKTVNGGLSWTDFAGAGRPATAVTSIAINPIDNSIVMVTYGGYINNNVWLTEDGGNTWSQRTGVPPNNLPAIQVNTVRFHPLYSTWVYIGTDLGVFASEDRGLTWNTLPSYGQNEGPANVEVSQLFWQGNDFLIAATFGRGMFRSRPNTGVFVNLNNPNPGDGTLGNPFRVLQSGINAQPNGAPLFIFSGSYQQGPVTFTKRGPVRVWNGPVVIR